MISGNAEAGVVLFGFNRDDPVNVEGNLVQGNVIGTDASGARAILRAGVPVDAPGARQGRGILVDDSPRNTIGGATPGSRNVLSGNLVGVFLTGINATGTLVQGNFIGTDASGRRAVGNQFGVLVADAGANTIGGATPGAGNLIAGNNLAVGGRRRDASVGVYLRGGSARNNLVAGNFIGTDVTGAAPLSNGTGVFVENAPDNTIGGTTPQAGNRISGNLSVGVYLLGAEAARNQVVNNVIGARRGDGPLLGNGEYGVLLFNAPSRVGDPHRNVIVRGGAGAPQIRGSGIGNFREFTGSVSSRAGSGSRLRRRLLALLSLAERGAET